MCAKKISIYIPCFNAEKTIAACLDAVFKQDYPVVEVVVIDDGSEDKSADIASSYPVRVLRHEINRGLAAVRNTAFKNIDTEFVGSLDADCVAESDWLSCLMRCFDDPRVCGSGGMLVEDRISSVFDLWRSIHMKQHWGPGNCHPEFLYGANTIFRREVLLSAGLYEERLRNNYEDVDICRRLVDLGWLLFYDSSAVVHHLKEDDLSSLFNTYWNWRREYYCTMKFFSGPELFEKKMKDNVGLANRYLEEDLLAKRDQLLYLDFFLAVQHSLKDLEYFVFGETGVNGVKDQPYLSSWLALTDLVFCYHFSEKKDPIPSFLGQQHTGSLNFIAILLLLNRSLEDRFGPSGFKPLLYKHLLFSFYRVRDNVLLEKIVGLLKERPNWAGILEKEHPFLNHYFLNISLMIKRWMDEKKFRSSDLTSRIVEAQQIVEWEINKKEGINVS